MITYIVAAIFIGWFTGILVNYLADVLPLRRKPTKPFCIHCDTTQSWINYLFWPRRCPTCNLSRGYRIWVVEIFFMIASSVMFLNPPYRVGYPLGMVILAYFGAVVIIDIEYRLIMHPVSIFGAVLGFITGLVNVGWEKTLIGGMAGFIIMWLLYQLGVMLIKVIDRSRGHPVNDVALGFGDVNLSGVLGLMLGWPLILVGLVIAILIGGVVSLVYLILQVILRKYHAFMALPYAPFLVIGAGLLIYFRDALLLIISP